MTRTLPLLLLAGCLDLDGFVFNPVHCSTVGPSTCEDVDNPWDRVCTPCDTPYDWGRDYPWFDGQLEDGESIRAIPAERITRAPLATEDGEGELDLYLIASHGEVPELADTTIVYNHGNYAGIEHYLPRVRALHEAGYTVLVWDYRGYGKSTPDTAPTAEQFLADARQVRAEAAALAPDPARVVPYAYSLGGIPAVEMAVHDPGCALVAEAAWTSVSAIARADTTLTFGETFLSEGRYDVSERLGDYDGPLLAMIGDEDNKFSVADTEAMVARATGPTELWVLEGVKHGIGNRGVVEAGYGAWSARLRGFLEDRAPACLGR